MEAIYLATINQTLQGSEIKHFTFSNPPEELSLESGEKLGPITLAYETYGELNDQISKAILVIHALSGDNLAAGAYGWWDSLIGPG